jgi:lauroyl/myristoyl acyltransferase
MVFGESRAKDVYRRLVWGPYRRSFDRLPPASEIRANRALGRLVALLARGKRDGVMANLQRAFPERGDLEQVIEEIFATHFADQYISWSFARLTPENLDAYLRFEGREHLDEALAGGVGVVMMHPHMGPAQLPLCALGALGYRMNQIGGGGVEGEISETGRWATQMRHSLEENCKAQIWNGGGFLRPVLRALKGGEVVMTAMDGTGGGRELGRRYPRAVLGQTMNVPVGPVYLALRSGAPLLTLYTSRDRGGDALYVTRIGPPLALPRDLPVKQGLEAGADVVAARLETLLRAHPGEWHFWDEFRPGRFLFGEDI